MYAANPAIPYTLEELLPLVSKLACQYTGGDSTSISYATAQQLMASILYCLQTAATAEENNLLPTESERPPAAQTYALGAALVERRTQQALALYQQIIANFNAYENVFLQDTMEKELPEFFKHYDVRFAAHTDLLTLSYPVKQDLHKLHGIDKILTYLQNIQREQQALAQLPPDFVQQILTDYNPFYRDTPDNLWEIVQLQLNK